MPKTEIQKEQNRRSYHRNRAQNLVWQKAYRERLRDICILAYGGYVCGCCGEQEPSMLSLDHINNDGYKHRKEIGYRGGVGLYRWIVRNNFPPLFQVLCFNCNQSKRINGGTCAHQKGFTLGHSFEQSGPGDTIINMRRPDGHAHLDQKYDKGNRSPWLGVIGNQDAGLVSPETSEQSGSGHMDSGYSGVGGTNP